MRHLTKRAEYYTAHRDLGYDLKSLLAGEFACGSVSYTVLGALVVEDVRAFFESGAPLAFPDCPQCAVLWDQAVAAGELVKTAWLKADEDNNEAYWKTLNTGVAYKRRD